VADCITATGTAPLAGSSARFVPVASPTATATATATAKLEAARSSETSVNL
jgi:hypothetical protein